MRLAARSRSSSVRWLVVPAVAALLVACGSSTGSAPTTSGSATTTSTVSPSGSAASSSSPTAATLPAQPGTVTAQDDFSNEAKHLFRDSVTSAYRVGVVMGTYRILLLTSGTPHGEIRPVSGTATTVSIAMTMSAQDLSGGFMGPICFYQQGYGFSLQLQDDGTYSLVQVSPQGEVMATLATAMLDGYDQSTNVRLRLDCTWGQDASTVTGWVDTHQIGPSQDQASALRNFFREWSGIGFWAMSTTTPTTVLVDDVVISEKT